MGDNKTVRELQRDLLTQNIFKEMDVLEKKAGQRNALITQRASDLLSQGFSEDECVDLLSVEGVDPIAARNCVASCNGSMIEDFEEDSKSFGDLSQKEVNNLFSDLFTPSS
jgi:hypothetical protein